MFFFIYANFVVCVSNWSIPKETSHQLHQKIGKKLKKPCLTCLKNPFLHGTSKIQIRAPDPSLNIVAYITRHILKKKKEKSK